MTNDPTTHSRVHRGIVWALLGALVAAQAAISTWWMSAHGFFTRPPTSDAAWYRIDALGLLEGFRDGWSGFLARVLAHDRPHPPTLPALAAIVAHIRGHDDAILTTDAFCVTLFFGAVMTLGAYRLARVYLSRLSSLAAAALAACIPVVVVYQRAFYPQMPMSALSIWAVAELLRSQGFERRGATLRFGLFAGAATMMKMLAPLTFAGAALFTLAARIRATGQKRRAWINLGCAILVASLVMAPWYAQHWRATLAYASDVTGSQGQNQFSRGIPVDSIARWVYYPLAILNNGFTPQVTILLIVAAIWGWRRTRGSSLWDLTTSRHGGVLLLANFVTGWLITTYGQVAGEAFYMQAFLPPAMILLIAHANSPSETRWIRRALAVVAAAWMLWLGTRSFRDDEVDAFRTWPSAEWRSVELSRNHLRVELIPRIDYMHGWFAVAAGANDSAEGEHWPNEEWAGLVRAHSRHERPKMTSVIDPKWVAYEHPYLNHSTIVYEALRRNWRPDWTRTEKLYSTSDVGVLINKVREFDYVVVDHRGDFTREAITSLLGTFEIPHSVIATADVTAVSKLSLIELRRPYDEGRFAGELPTSNTVASVTPATFASIFKVVAITRAVDAARGLVVHVWLDSDKLRSAMRRSKLAPTEAILRLEDASGGWLGACIARADPIVPPPEGDGHRFMSLMFDRFDVKDLSRVSSATLTLRPRGSKDDTQALSVDETALPVRGKAIVLRW